MQNKSKYTVLWLLSFGLFVHPIGCGGESEKGGTQASTSVDCSKKSGTGNHVGTELSAVEAEILAPHLADIRQGVREWATDSVGLCRKTDSKGCDENMGKDAQLPEGVYVLRGEFQAPKLEPQGGWQVSLSVECQITKESKNGKSTTNKSYSKEYTVSHVPGTERGYKLSPMYEIKSPSASGNEKCSWKIEGEGLTQNTVWQGTYSVPAK